MTERKVRAYNLDEHAEDTAPQSLKTETYDREVQEARRHLLTTLAIKLEFNHRHSRQALNAWNAIEPVMKRLSDDNFMEITAQEWFTISQSVLPYAADQFADSFARQLLRDLQSEPDFTEEHQGKILEISMKQSDAGGPFSEVRFWETAVHMLTPDKTRE